MKTSGKCGVYLAWKKIKGGGGRMTTWYQPGNIWRAVMLLVEQASSLILQREKREIKSRELKGSRFWQNLLIVRAIRQENSLSWEAQALCCWVVVFKQKLGSHLPGVQLLEDPITEQRVRLDYLPKVIFQLYDYIKRRKKCQTTHKSSLLLSLNVLWGIICCSFGRKMNALYPFEMLRFSTICIVFALICLYLHL